MLLLLLGNSNLKSEGSEIWHFLKATLHLFNSWVPNGLRLLAARMAVFARHAERPLWWRNIIPKRTDWDHLLAQFGSPPLLFLLLLIISAIRGMLMYNNRTRVKTVVETVSRLVCGLLVIPSDEHAQWASTLHALDTRLTVLLFCWLLGAAEIHMLCCFRILLWLFVVLLAALIAFLRCLKQSRSESICQWSVSLI